MIALFDEPPRVHLKMTGLNSTNGMLLGMALLDPGHLLRGLVCLEDGTVTMLPTDAFSIDWRYNAETDQWVDVNHPQGGQEP